MSVSKKKKWLIAAAVSFGLIVAAIFGMGLLRFANYGFFPYNAETSDLDIPKTKIYFSRPQDCGFSFDACNKTDIFEIFTDGTGLQFLFSVDPGTWPPYPAFGKRTIMRSMGWYSDTNTIQVGSKKIRVDESPTEAKLSLYDGDKEQVLEEKRGLLPMLGIETLTLLEGGRFLLVEDSRQRIGIYDIESRKYAYLTDGQMAVPAADIEGLDLSSLK